MNICIFCGSSHGHDHAYREAAVAAARSIAESGAALVYGGGRVGLMGAVADAALAAGGGVIGIMPRSSWRVKSPIAVSAVSRSWRRCTSEKQA